MPAPPSSASPPPRGRLDPASAWFTVLLTALVAFGPMSTDLYLPSLPDITRHFAADVSQGQMTLSLFIIGFGSGMLVLGPLSDRHGRRPVLIAGTVVYTLASAACLLAPTIEALIGLRFVQALGACTAPVLARAMVRDLYPPHQAARKMSLMASAMTLAPIVGPSVGGALHTLFGWQANFAVLVLFGAVMLAVIWLGLPETNRHKDPLATAPGRVMGNYLSLMGSRVFLAHTLAVGCSFAAVFSFLSGSSFVLIDVLGIPPAWFGLVFAGVVVGFASGAFLAMTIVGRLGLRRTILLGAAVSAAAALAGAGLALAGVQTLAAVVGPITAVLFGAALVIPNGTAGAISPFPARAGAASGLLGFLQMACGAAAGWLVGRLHDGSTLPMMAIIATTATLALIIYALAGAGAGDTRHAGH